MNAALPTQPAGDGVAGANDDNQLSKNFYHDSGIDICDSVAAAAAAAGAVGNLAPIQNKKVYSDADIVLSSEWVPPKTLTTTRSVDTSSSNTISNLLNQNVETGARKKTSSVSFSVDDDQASNQSQPENNEKSDKKGKVGVFFFLLFLDFVKQSFMFPLLSANFILFFLLNYKKKIFDRIL